MYKIHSFAPTKLAKHMNNFFLSILCLMLIKFSCVAQTNDYPKTINRSTKEYYFTREVLNSFRELENLTSDTVKNWVNEENNYTYNYISKIPVKFNVQLKIEKNHYFETFTPKKYGKYFIYPTVDNELKTFDFYYTTDLKTVQWDVISIQKDLTKNAEEAVNMRDFAMSKDSKYLAYSISRDGSDWTEIRVAHVKTGKLLDDKLINVKFSDIVWREDGFYYNRYDSVAPKGRYTDALKNHKLYYHKIGTNQDADLVVYKKNNAPNNFFSVQVSEDEKFVTIEDRDAVNNLMSYYYQDYNNPEQTSILPIARNINYYIKVLSKKNDTLIVEHGNTKIGRVVAIPLNDIKKRIELVPQLSDAEFGEAMLINNNFLVLISQNAEEKIAVFDSNKKLIKLLALPFGSHFTFNSLDKEQNLVYFSVASFLHPPALLKMNINNYQLDVEFAAKVNYESQDYEIVKHEYNSDSVKVPLLLMHKKGIKLDGNNPVLIEIYGGFGSIITPHFDPAKIMFIENGGIYAYPMIRGGGELDLKWEYAGKKLNKMNSIIDIKNCANYLTEKKFSSHNKIAVTGGSQGGLMAAAAAILFPSHFKVAIPIVGVHDMIHAEDFTIGPIHIDEFGTKKDSLQFLNLLSYSPLYNIKKGVTYPAMLIMTSAFDDRVPPLHSYKLAAQLQSYNNPNTILRVEKDEGHYGGHTYKKALNAKIDFYSFLYYNLGINQLPK